MAIIGENVFLNWIPLTGGLEGIYGIPRPEVFGWHVSTRSDFALFAGILCVITLTFLWALIRSPYGRTLVALRDDDVAARALGKNTLVFKVSIFAITGALAGLIGSGYASYIQFVNPDDFTIHLAIVLVAMVLVGGMGTVKGAMVGAVLLVAIPESLRMVAMPPSMVGVAQKALYGLVLVLFALLRPQGLFPDRGASLQLAPPQGRRRRPRRVTSLTATGGVGQDSPLATAGRDRQ
jgi:branched-chain amino acid transport system permease protein